jgi:DNA-binding NarL/FixJ family response regulator
VLIDAPISSVKTILLAEDHPLVADAIRELLSQLGATLRTVICNCAQTALHEFRRSSKWYRILLDLDVPGAQVSPLHTSSFPLALGTVALW